MAIDREVSKVCFLLTLTFIVGVYLIGFYEMMKITGITIIFWALFFYIIS